MNMSSTFSFPTSTYHPISKPCSASRMAPKDKKTRSDHQPNRKLRSTRCAGNTCLEERFIPREKPVFRRVRSAIVGKHLAENGHLNRWRSPVDKLRSRSEERRVGKECRSR